MSDQPGTYRKALQDKAASGVVVPLHRDGSDDLDTLRDTVLLILGPDRRDAAPYRLWAAQLGGMGLFIDREFGLLDWLERNTFVKSIVLIDDPRLSPGTAADIAAETRVLRPDVPVILALDPDDDDEDFSADARWPSFAVEHRPFSLTSFIKAINIARLMATFDREAQPRRSPHTAGETIIRPSDADMFDDTLNRHSGWWVIPTVVAGLLIWATILALTLPGLFADPRLPN